MLSHYVFVKRAKYWILWRNLKFTGPSETHSDRLLYGKLAFKSNVLQDTVLGNIVNKHDSSTDVKPGSYLLSAVVHTTRSIV